MKITSDSQLRTEVAKLVKDGATKILRGTTLPLNDYVGTTTGHLELINTKATDVAPKGYIIFAGKVELELDGKKIIETVSCIDEDEASCLLTAGNVVGFSVIEDPKGRTDSNGNVYKRVQLTAVQLSGETNVAKTTKQKVK